VAAFGRPGRGKPLLKSLCSGTVGGLWTHLHISLERRGADKRGRVEGAQLLSQPRKAWFVRHPLDLQHVQHAAVFRLVSWRRKKLFSGPQDPKITFLAIPLIAHRLRPLPPQLMQPNVANGAKPQPVQPNEVNGATPKPPALIRQPSSGPGVSTYAKLEQLLPNDYYPLQTPLRRMEALFALKFRIERNLSERLGLQMVQVRRPSAAARGRPSPIHPRVGPADRDGQEWRQ